MLLSMNGCLSLYIVSMSCRPPEMGVPPPGKAVLSMGGLSHSVIRVDTEEKLSVLTVQDVGQVMPGGKGHTALLINIWLLIMNYYKSKLNSSVPSTCI